MTAALDLITWLMTRAIDPTNGAVVRERYKLADVAWGPDIRPDCNAEAVHAFLCAYQATGNAAYLTRSRAIWDGFKGLQRTSLYAGSWPYSNLISTNWTNADSEVAIFLCRAALLDPVNAAVYVAAARATVGWMLPRQDVTTHMWPAASYLTYQGPMFTAQAVAALAMVYSTAPSNAATILTAIETGLTALTTKIGTDGRIQAANETAGAGAEESWRPPSSDQAVAIRAYAMAAHYCPTSTHVAAWNAARQTLLGWMNQLIHSTGAVCNGLGSTALDADVAYITDHVYTTSLAMEGYYYSYLVDQTSTLMTTVTRIARFAAGNVWYDPTYPDAYGVLRGAYNLRDSNFDTSIVVQDGGEEGGGNMAYTGWSAAPVAAMMLLELASALTVKVPRHVVGHRTGMGVL